MSFVLAVSTDGPGHVWLFEGVSDADLVDGAGQVILEFLKSTFDGLNQMEILDAQDLKNAIGATLLAADKDRQLEECMAELNRALRLLGAGYYRSLLLEERERVGKVNYRFEAMMKFRERIRSGDEGAERRPA